MQVRQNPKEYSMKVFVAISALLSFLASNSEAIGFAPDGPSALWGVVSRGGGSKKVSSEEEDYEKAEKAILQAVTTVEDHAQRMIAAEVETLFHGLPKSQKKDVAERARKAVSEGSRKVKQKVDNHKKETAEGTFVYPFEDHPYPYAYPQINNKNKPDPHKDHRILHAVEAAEKAVLHAIEGEVDTLFHHEEHHEDAAADAQKHKTTVKEGLKKASKRVEDHHEDRRSWLQKNIDRGLLDYPPSMFLE